MDKLTFYRSFFKKEWRWKYQSAGNNENLANGGEGYQNVRDCVKSAARVLGVLVSEIDEGTVVREGVQAPMIEVEFKL